MSEDNEKLFGDQKIPTKVIFKRVLHYIKPEWLSFLLAFLLMIINVAADVVLPLFIGKFTDALAETNVTMAYITSLAMGYFILAFVSQILIYFEAMLLQHAGQRIVYKLRMEGRLPGSTFGAGMCSMMVSRR